MMVPDPERVGVMGWRLRSRGVRGSDWWRAGRVAVPGRNLKVHASKRAGIPPIAVKLSTSADVPPQGLSEKQPEIRIKLRLARSKTAENKVQLSTSEGGLDVLPWKASTSYPLRSTAR